MKDDEFWKKRNTDINVSAHGLLIVNQGNFTYDNASLSYYNIEEAKVYDSVFLM